MNGCAGGWARARDRSSEGDALESQLPHEIVNLLYNIKD